MLEKTTYSAVHEPCVAYREGRLTQANLIDALIVLPVVKRQARTGSDFRDGWAPEYGPVYEVSRAYIERLIPEEAHDAALLAMWTVGHEA